MYPCVTSTQGADVSFCIASDSKEMIKQPLLPFSVKPVGAHWQVRLYIYSPFIHLNCGRCTTQGDFKRVDIEPRADVENQLLRESVAQLEGSTDEAGHFLGAVCQLFVELLRVGLLEGEQVCPGLRVGVAEVETPENGHHVVQGV